MMHSNNIFHHDQCMLHSSLICVWKMSSENKQIRTMNTTKNLQPRKGKIPRVRNRPRPVVVSKARISFKHFWSVEWFYKNAFFTFQLEKPFQNYVWFNQAQQRRVQVGYIFEDLLLPEYPRMSCHLKWIW